MGKLLLGALLTMMMFGHNFVLNQTQTMQAALQHIHDITITEFNLLYSLPSAAAILFIIPIGFCYQKYANALLWTGAIALSLGQLLIASFGAHSKPYFYAFMMTGRVIEGIGAEILYMIQGNMASSWMGRYAGLVFILPEVGEIANVFVTPWTYQHWGVGESFLVGFFTCLLSTIACLMIYYHLRKNKTAKDDVSEDSISAVEYQPQSEDREQNGEEKGKKSILQAGQVFWLVVVLCGINQCLYFPFLDNANELITNRFCIDYQQTGYYLSIPFLAAMLTSAISSKVLQLWPRPVLILASSLLPLAGHGIIFLDENCGDAGATTTGKLTLIVGFCFFGMGIGAYYSISFPGVGLSVPREIRGMGYACMAFFQTIAMTLIPICSGYIVETEQRITKLSEGYKQSSLLFVWICLAGVALSAVLWRTAKSDSFRFDDEDRLQMVERQATQTDKEPLPS